MDWEEAKEALDDQWAAVADAFETGEPGAYDDDARLAVKDLQDTITDVVAAAMIEVGRLRVPSINESYSEWRRLSRQKFFRTQKARVARSFNRRMVSAGYTLAHKASRFEHIRKCIKQALTYKAPKY